MAHPTCLRVSRVSRACLATTTELDRSSWISGSTTRGTSCRPTGLVRCADLVQTGRAVATCLAQRFINAFLGPQLISVITTTFLFALALSQSWTYFAQASSTDPRRLKLAIVASLLFVVAGLVLEIRVCHSASSAVKQADRSCAVDIRQSDHARRRDQLALLL